MKLRLPHKFQAALMAALASVSFTTLSSGTIAVAAGAAFLTGQKAKADFISTVDLEDWEGYDAATGVATLGNTGSAINHGEFDQPNQGWNSNWNFVIVVDASTLASGTTYDLITTTIYQESKDSYINGAQMVVSADGTTATVINQGWKNNNTSGPQVFSLNDVETLTFVMSREGSKSGNVVLRGYANGNFDTALVTAAVSGVDLSFSANIRQVNVGALDGLTPHKNVESGVYQVPDANIGSFGVTKAGYSLNSTLSRGDLLTFYNSVELTWAGSSTNHTWTSGSATEWTGGTFVNGSDVIFDSSASEHVVLVNSAIETGRMKVSDAYTYEVGSNGSLSVGRLSGAGAITKTGSGTLMLSGNNSGFTGAVNVNAGSLDLASSVGVSDLSVASGATLKLAGAGMLSAGNLTLASGSVLDVSNITQMAGLTVGLASYTGTVSYEGATVSGISSSLDYTLNATDGLLTLTFASKPQPTPTPVADLGKVMYVGDSITDGVSNKQTGVNAKSWRYSFFQVLADGGISQVEEGYYQHHQSSGAIPDGQTASYGGRTFENIHSAQASARSWETAGVPTSQKGGNRYGYSSIQNWLGQSETLRNGNAYTGAVYKDADAPDTFFMLLGTNDLLSEGGNNVTETHFNNVMSSMFGYSGGTFDGQSGTFDIIWKSMTDARSDAKLIVLEMPTWSPNHDNHNTATDFAYLAKFNQKLHEWAAIKNSGNITIVNPNPGIVDVANTTKPGSGVPTMFIDGLHPSAQGELLMAGNIAKQLGYAGRSVGLDRAASGTPGTQWASAPSSTITVAVGTPQTFAVDAFYDTDGYTVDFGALYGNGLAGGWDTGNALSVKVGDGTHTGTLTFNEAYIKWGDTILYSRDNSQAGDNFRIAYVNAGAKASDNVSAGYYVWMGDQLIGEALNPSSGDFNGIQLTSTGTSATVSNLTWSDTAYAPTTNRFVNPDESALFHLVQADPNPPHDNTPTRSGVDFTGATTINQPKGITSSSQFAGDAVFVQSNRSSWIAASGVNFDHSITAKIDGGNTITATIFGVQGGTTQGDVTLDISNVTIGDQGTYSGAKAAIAGAFSTANIDGTFTVYVTNSTIGGNIVGGAVGGAGSVGAFELYLNSGSVNGSIYGGPNGGNNAGGTIGDVSITINGGHVTGDINGGAQKGSVTGNSTIVVKGGIIDGDIIGGVVAEGKSSTVTIESNKPLIGGDITADAVVLKNITPKGEDDFFDTYAGTITGNTSITLDGYAVQNMAASLVTRTLNLINSSRTTIHDLTLTACSINVDGTSSATLADSVTLGNTATYTGDLTLANGLAINVAGMGITGEEKSVNLFTTQSGTLNADATQLSIVGLAQDAPVYYLSNTNNNLVLTFGAPPQDLIWDGSTNTDWSTDQDDLNWHTSASTETHLPFATGDNVTFSSGTAVLQEEITAGTMTLTNGGSTVTINTNGNNLTVNNLVSAEATPNNKFTKTGAGTATFNGNDTAHFDVLSIGADAGTTIFNQHVVQTGTTRFDVSSDVSFLNGYEYTGTQGYGLLVTNSATVTLGGESNMSTKNVGMNNSNAKLVLAENASLTVSQVLNSSSNKGRDNGTLDMRSGSVLTLTGQNLYLTGATSDGGTIHLGNNAVVNLYAGSYQPNIMEFGLGNIVLDGNSPTTTIRTTNWGGTVKLDSVSGSGTLVLRAQADSTVRNTFSIGGNAEAPSFNGTIELQREGGASRVLVAEFNDAESAAGAVVQTKLTGNHNAESVGIAINSSTVKMKGLNDGSGITSANSYALFSGSASRLANTNGNASTYLNNASDDTARTLEFVGTDSAASYSTAIKVLNNVNLKMSSAGSQSFTGDLSTMNGTVTASAGTLTLDNSGATAGSLASVIVNGGTLVLDDMNVSGAVTLGSGTLDLLSDTSTGAFALNGGTLKFADADSLSVTGTFNIGGSSVLDLSRITVSGPSSITLASTTAGVTGNLGDISLQGLTPLAGYDTALETIDNNLVLTFTPQYDGLIWNATDGYWSNQAGDANWHTSADTTAHLPFTSNSNVRFDSNANNRTVTLTDNITAGTVEIMEGVTVTINDQNSKTLAGKLQGSGTYALASGDSSLPGSLNVQDSGWTGTVKLSNATDIQQLDLNTYGHAGSKVELSGVSGYLKNSKNYTYSPRMVLSGDGLTITDGYSDYSYTFAGGVEGDGDFMIAGTTGYNKQTYIFTGDVSNWTGSYESTKDKTSTLKFYGQATEVGAEIKRTAGTINIEVGNGNDAFSTTFDQAVSATKLEIKNGATATFKEALQLSGDLTMDGTTEAQSTAVLEKGGSVGVIDLSNRGTAHGSVTVKAGKNLTYGSSFWSANNNQLILEEGATVAKASGAPITIEGLSGNGTVSNSADSQLTLDNGNFTLNNVLATINTASNDVQLLFTNSELVTGQNVTLKNASNSLTSTTVTGNTLTVAAGMDLGAVSVNAGTLALTSSGVTIGSGTIASGATLAMSDGPFTVDDGVFSLASGSTLDLSSWTSITGEQPITLGTASGGSFSTEGLSGVNLTFADPTLAERATLGVEGNNLVLTFAQPVDPKNLIWDNAAGNNTWDAGASASANWHEAESTDHIAFTNNDNATFDSDSADATVTMSGAVTAGTMTVGSGADVTIVTGTGNTLSVTNGITIEQGGVLAQQGTGLSGTLKGAGTYDLTGKSLGSVQLGSDWTGAVRLTNQELNSTGPNQKWLAGLRNGNSWIEMNGFTGYDSSWASSAGSQWGDLTANIRLLDGEDGNPAWKFNASAAKGYTMNATGKWEGDGTFLMSTGTSTQSQAVTFTGDISRWTGLLATDAAGERTVTFAGNANKVNAEIDTLGSGALNVVVDNAATFSKNVDATKLTINSGKSATLTGGAQIDTLAGEGKLVVDGANTTTTIGSGTNFSGAIDLLGGTLDLTNALTGVGAVNLGTGSTAATLKLAGGDTAALTSTGTITLGSNLTLDLSNYNSYTLDQPVTLASATGFSGDAGSVSLTGLNLVEGYKATLSVVDTTNLVLTISDESENLVWLDPVGTWTAQGAWYESDKSTPATFENGDSGTIVVGNYDDGATISLVADASARSVIVQKAEDGTGSPVVTIKDKVNENRLGMNDLTLQEGTTLVANTQLEVTETVQIGTDAELQLNSPKDATISANISSTDATAVITKQGDNTLTLTGDNTHYNGAIDVTDGTLAAQSQNALGGADVTVSGGAELSLENRAAMNGVSLTLNSGSTISFLGDTELNLTDSLTLGAGVTWDLTRYGFNRPAEGQTTGTATLINVAKMDPDSIANLIATSRDLILTPGIINDAALSYQDGSVILTFTADPQGNLFWKGGVGTWNTDSSNTTWYPSREGGQLTQFYKGDNVTFDARAAVSSVTLTEDITAGTVTVENGTRVTLRGGDASLTADNIVVQGTLGTEIDVTAPTVSIADTGMWIVSGDKDREFAGQLTGTDSGTGTLAKSSSGDLLLSGDNSAFTGEIQLNSGTITAGHENALGAGTNIAMGNGTEVKGSFNTNGDTFTTLKGANSTVSAALNINAAGLTVSGDGNTALSGDISGTGSLVKDGFGTATLSGNLDDFTGKVTVEQGTLALDSDFTTSTGFELAIGSRMQLAEQNEGTGEIVYTYKDGKKIDPSTINFNVDGTLALHDGSYIDMSNIHLNSDGIAGVATFDSLDAVEADKIGDTEDQYYYKFLEGISIENLEGVGGTTYARLVRDEKNNLVYVQTFGGTNGAYWKGDADTGAGEWNRGGSQSTGDTSMWRTEQNGTTKATYNWDRKVSMSAYFFELTNSEGNTIDETTVTLVTSFPQVGSANPAKGAGDVIIDGATKYKFVSTGDNYLVMNNQYPVAIIVRSGSTAEFDFGIDASNGSWISVEKGATMIVDTRGKPLQYGESGSDYAQLYNVTNDGTMDMIVGRTWLKHVINNQDMSIRAYEDVQTVMGGGSIQASVVYNALGATLTMSGECIVTDYLSLIRDEDVKFTNDGTIVLNGSSITESPSGKMIDTLPVVGTGVLKTGEEEGAHAEIVFGNYSGVLFATVEQSALELGADVTTFEYGVNITDTTTVLAGKAANFYGGTGVGETAGSLGEVTLEDEATITFGPRVEVDTWTGDPTGIVTAQSYDMGHVTAGADSVLTVQKGATVTMDGFNAASGVPAGEIVVGTMPDGAPDLYDGTASLTIDGPAAVDTVRVLADTATINGRADINQIMQDGGVLTLNADSVLNGTDGNGGTVTGGELVLAGGKTLDQNAVIDVRTAAGSETEGTYTVRGGEGSRIDASDLKLIVDYTKTNYVAVKHGGEEGKTSLNESGFMASGDEYVKLFDIQYNTEESGEKTPVQTLHGGNEAVYHSGASGMMTLIDSDNWNTIPHGEGYDLEEYIGYGYLHTEEKRLTTYYVRDQYTDAEENEVTLTDLIEGSVDPNDPYQLKQLENVVFDKTEYNTGFSPYNGTLTVNAHMDGEDQTKDHTSIDRFSVSGDAKAAINIADGTTVTANADSTGVAGKLDLQGSGVYEITDRNDLGTNIALRDDTVTPGAEWDGTVRVTGTSTDLTLEDKSVGTGADASTIEFRNWNGALDGGDHTVNGQVVLSAETPTAMKLTGEDDIAYTFTNTVSGGGNINHAEGGNVAMTFAGDTSGWNGTYEQHTDTDDSLTFTGGTTVNADVTSGNGTMDLTYGGSVTTVAGDVNVYSGGDTPTTMNVTYTGADKAVTGGITSDAQSNLTLTVGDGKQATNATFTGTFAGTENATMAVQSGSTATIGTDAELLRVVGDEGSNVVVNSGSTLSLASTTPETGYSEFHDLTNAGTIEMMANGGEIHLVDDTAEGNTYNLGNLVLTDPVGTATIETYGVADQETDVNISGLTGPKSAAQVLELMNGNGTGTVNYNLGNTDDAKDLNGTIAYGGSGGETNLVIKENGNSAASAVLETRFASADDTATANVVVDAEKARIQGLTSDANSNSNKTMVVSGREDPGDPGNRTLNITGDGEYYYAGQLGGDLDVAYTGNGMQVINGGVSGFDGKVTVDNGSTAAGVLAILNAASVDITDLTIGANDRLSVADGTAVVSHSVLATGGPTTKGNGSASTLEGSLTLGSGSTYDVSAAGGIGGLNLTGALTINEGAQLSSSDISTLWGLKIGDSYDLAFGVVDVNFGDDVVTKDDQIDASQYFTNLYPGEFYICYTGANGSEGSAGSNVGTVYLYKATPEPTTGTLSLLALAALAARRRRK